LECNYFCPQINFRFANQIICNKKVFSFQTKKSILKALITKKSPYYIQFYINGVCHLKCKQCNIVETNSGIGELTLDQMKIVAKNIKKIDGGIVLLTGGEPFLRKDIDQVAKCFIDEGLDVRLQTAGIATKEQLQNCYDVGVRDINISLDSLIAEKQDYINTSRKSWQKAIEAIERVSLIFRDHSAICSIGCVLSRYNFREIPAILDFATNIGWYLSLVPVHISAKENFMGFRSYEDSFKFRNDDFLELKEILIQIIEMKQNGHLLFDSERFLWSSYVFLQNGKSTWRKNDICDSANLYFAIRPNGDFTTCCDYVLNQPPSLLDPDFVNKFKSGEIQKQADPIVRSCNGCHYGSYPEVTISVRNKRAFLDRLIITLFQEKSIIKRFEKSELFKIINEVKIRFPDIYKNQTMDNEITRIIERWEDPEQRRQLVLEDRAKRELENRIRKPKMNELVSKN